MWLWLLEDACWCQPGSFIRAAGWKQQKQAMARCLDLLLAAVYVEAGLEAAMQVASVLLCGTPPTTHDKSWMPAWTRHSSS